MRDLSRQQVQQRERHGAVPLCDDIGLLHCNPATGLASPRAGFWAFTATAQAEKGVLHTVPCQQPTLCLGAVPGQPGVTRCASTTRLQSASNVECSQCAAGHSEWGGHCLPCESVNAGLVFLVMLLTFVYVAVTHHVSQEQSASGLASVFLYFAQTALLIAGSITSVSAVSTLSILRTLVASASARFRPSEKFVWR